MSGQIDQKRQCAKDAASGQNTIALRISSYCSHKAVLAFVHELEHDPSTTPAAIARPGVPQCLRMGFGLSTRSEPHLLDLPPARWIIRCSFAPEPATIPYDSAAGKLAEGGENLFVDRGTSVCVRMQKLFAEFLANADSSVLWVQFFGSRLL